MNARRPHAWLAAAWLLATGCAAGTGAVDLKQLPAAPVALLYRPEALAMERVGADELRHEPKARLLSAEGADLIE